MKNRKLTAFVLAAIMIAVLGASCASTNGNYMPLSSSEPVIGNVQSTFVVQSSLFFLKSAKDAVNKEAYIKLLEAAGNKYPDAILDIRDIEWVTGRTVDAMNTEIVANGKVIRIN